MGGESGFFLSCRVLKFFTSLFLGRGVCDSRGTEWDLCVNVGIARTGTSSWDGRICLEGDRKCYFEKTIDSSIKTSIFF